nr:M20/M25/M40 family metallo-hydrolase [Phycisphaerales bacterium]
QAGAPEFWNNIIVEIPGVELPGEVVLIGAHFDAVARSPGADDNGSGTAALLESARVLRGHPMRRTVRLVFFNLEEIGLIGSRHHAARHAAEPQDQNLVAMVSLECIGFYCVEPGCQKTPVEPIKGVFEPSTTGDFLAAVTIAAHKDVNRRFARAFESASQGLRIEPFDFLPVPIPDILRSDHAPFLAQGVPAIMLTGTANFRNPHYHKPTDTVETIDQDRLVRAVRGIVAATIDLAEPSPTPAPTDQDRSETRR